MFRKKKTSNQLTRAELEFLTKFKNGFSSNDKRAYWNDYLSKGISKTITKFKKNGLIQEGDLVQKIEYLYKVTELKKFLKKMGEKVSGRKHELAERASAFPTEAFVKKADKLTLYTLSDNGAEKANGYLQFKATEREKAENQCFEFLKSHKYKQALLATAKFEAKQVFQRGLGIDWKNYNPQNDISTLKIIFNCKPKILKNVNDDVLQHLRLAAGMTEIWGVNDGSKWLPKDFESNLRLKDDVAVRMVLFYGFNQRNLAEYKSIGVKKVQISPTETSCSECKKFKGKIYTLRNAPELPHEGCTHELGCRCMYLPIIPGMNH